MGPAGVMRCAGPCRGAARMTARLGGVPDKYGLSGLGSYAHNGTEGRARWRLESLSGRSCHRCAVPRGELMSTDAGAAAPRQTLQHFSLDDLAAYTAEQAFGPTASPDFRVFYVGRDDVHGVLMHLFTRVSLSVKMNMYGYDDDQLNAALMSLVQNPSIMVQVTLDKSQASGPAEKTILGADSAQNAAGFANDFVVGESATNQISHTKGGGLDGIVAFEGSTNWSSSGEGTGISLTAAKQAPGFKAQNNTLTVYVNPYEIAKFAARLDYEHAVAAAQKQPSLSAAAPAVPSAGNVPGAGPAAMR